MKQNLNQNQKLKEAVHKYSTSLSSNPQEEEIFEDEQTTPCSPHKSSILQILHHLLLHPLNSLKPTLK